MDLLYNKQLKGTISVSKEQPVETAPAPASTQTEKGFFILLYLTWRILFHIVQTKRNTEFQF